MEWLVARGFPYSTPDQRLQIKTDDGAKGEGGIEFYAVMMHGPASREHFAAQAIELIDLILREADRNPWQAIALAHQLGVLDGDARLVGVEPVWGIGHRSRAGAVAGGKLRSKRARDQHLAELYLSKRERAQQNLSDTEIKREIARGAGLKPDTGRKAIDRGLRALNKI